MNKNIALKEALIKCITLCEEIGAWSDNGDPMITPIEGEYFRDCADYCTLGLRLTIRSRLSTPLLEAIQGIIKICYDYCDSSSKDEDFTMEKTELIEYAKSFRHIMKVVQRFSTNNKEQ